MEGDLDSHLLGDLPSRQSNALRCRAEASRRADRRRERPEPRLALVVRNRRHRRRHPDRDREPATLSSLGLRTTLHRCHVTRRLHRRTARRATHCRRRCDHRSGRPTKPTSDDTGRPTEDPRAIHPADDQAASVTPQPPEDSVPHSCLEQRSTGRNTVQQRTKTARSRTGADQAKHPTRRHDAISR